MARGLQLFNLIIICHWYVAVGEIRNGYARHAREMTDSLMILRTVSTADTLSATERRTIREQIKVIIEYLACNDATDALLLQFRSISPDLYSRIDSLKDAKGRRIDVYVRIILREHATIPAAGVTRMLAIEEGGDEFFSEYGRQTVSIQIWAFADTLITLAHEMGHVAYQVPHFRQYLAYYRSRYHKFNIQPGCMGHEFDDDSGKTALLFERKFKHDRALDSKETHDRYKLDSAPVLVMDAKKKISSRLLFQNGRNHF